MSVARWLALAAIPVLLSCAATRPGAPAASAAGPATEHTRAAQRAFAVLPLADQQDFDDARRGLVARAQGHVRRDDGGVLIDFDAYDFLRGQAPPTVNPSLWRHAQLNAMPGLYRVTDGIWQVRGFDIANMTIVEGRTGWIVVDTLTVKESAAAAMAFVRQHLGDRPVSAVVFTHSHADHFGGVLGVVSAEDAARRGIPIVAPEGFLEEATSENILVGIAMARRATYQFGRNLPHSATGNVDTGLGKDVVAGAVGILPPTRVVTRPREELVLDGVRFVFHNVPGAEAPAELSFSLPDHRAYGAGENVNRTMHNLLPVRGAKVRDALRWSQYMQEAIDGLGDAEVLFSQHTWPVWGRERIVALLKAHRDVYKYTHDQTVRLANLGHTPREIAEMVKLPAALQAHFGARGYYGDLRHNVKAVYQHYLGFYDGNPARLDPLPPGESARRWIELAGGPGQALAAARGAFARGDYRWTAELLDAVVSADRAQPEARELLARTYEQLGFVAEAATWRNSYLTAAQELRDGPPAAGINRAAAVDALLHTPLERFFESIAAALDGPAAEGKEMKLNVVFTDLRESYVVWIENAVLHFRKAPPEADANVTLTLTRPFFVRMMAGQIGALEMLQGTTIDGSRLDLARFFGLLSRPQGTFVVVGR